MVTSMPLKYPAQTKQHREAIAAQVRLLDEAAVRIGAIDNILAQRELWHPSLSIEFAYLQFRMLCETIALLCLVAHGDIEATRTSKLQKDYAADNIIKKLEQLHPNFYPHPVTVSSTADGVHLERLSTGFLTKAELVSLYHDCGTRLHRGSLAKFRSTAPQAHATDVAWVHEWREKFVLLLRSHHIASLNNLSHYLCFLSHEQVEGKAMVVHALSPLPQ